MAFEFERKKGSKGSGLKDQEMADRLKKENERFRYATDSEYWSCLCFKTQEDKDSFCKLTGIHTGRFVSGEELREGVRRFKPEKKQRGFLRKPKSFSRVPNPLANVDYEQDLEKSSIDEAMALKTAFLAVEAPDPCKEATDSDIWTCAVFDTREEAEGFLAEWNLHRYGDKYLDASAWLGDIQ